VCTACGNNNFAFRATCNMRKCGAPKPDGTGAPGAMNGGGGYDGPAPQVGGSSADDGPPPEGSWTCSCGNVNYPFRTECNRRNCGLPRGAEAPASQGQAAIDPTGAVAATEGDAVPAANTAVDVTAEDAAAAAAPAQQEAVQEAAPAAEAAPTPELEAGAES
jgi:hypothetical protein